MLGKEKFVKAFVGRLLSDDIAQVEKQEELLCHEVFVGSDKHWVALYQSSRQV